MPLLWLSLYAEQWPVCDARNRDLCVQAYHGEREKKKEGCLSEGGPGKPGCLRVRRRAGRGEAGSAVTNLYAQRSVLHGAASDCVSEAVGR